MGQAMFGKGKSKDKHASESRFPSYKLGEALPVMPASALLKGRVHQNTIEKIAQISGLSSEEFSLLYGQLISDYAECVQLLPFSHTGYLGELLNKGLHDAFLGLTEYKARFLGEAVLKQERDQHRHVLLCYTLFTILLLRNLHKVSSLSRVMLCDETGTFISTWQPLSGSMLGQAVYYKLYDIHGVYDDVEDDLTILLAKQLMPKEGLDWIASDADIFIEWIKGLKGALEFEGRLLDILRFLHDIPEEVNNLLPPEMEEILLPSDDTGEAFLQWLKNGLADGSLNVNAGNAGIHRVSDGVFLEFPFLAKSFTQVFGREVPMARVFVQFGNLFGITKKSGQDFAFDQFFSSYPETRSLAKTGGFGGILSTKKSSTRQGLLVKDPYLLFKSSQLPSVSNSLRSISKSAERRTFFSKKAAQSKNAGKRK